MAIRKKTGNNPLKKLQLSITLLRILTGAYFGYMAWQKWHDPIYSAKLGSQLSFWAYSNPFFIYQDFLNGIVIPNVWLFANLVLWLEVLIGISYILGAFIPVFALLQLFLTINYLLAFGHTSLEPLTINGLFLVFGLLFYWNEAGQPYGLDSWIPWRLSLQQWRLQIVQ